MIDASIEAPKAEHPPEQRIRLRWPVLGTAIAFPMFMGVALAFLLWVIHLWDTTVWDPSFWLVPLSVILLAAIVLYTTWRLISAWAERNFRFSLQSMLVAMSVVALAIGTASQSYRRGIAVLDVAANGGYPENWSNREQNWLESRLRYDPFNEVQSLTVRSDQAIPSLLQHSSAFPELEQLSFRRGSTDASLRYAAEFNKFPKLTSGAFYVAAPNDKGMQHLRDWTRVQSLISMEAPSLTRVSRIWKTCRSLELFG